MCRVQYFYRKESYKQRLYRIIFYCLVYLIINFILFIYFDINETKGA